MEKFKNYFISILIPVVIGSVIGFIISKFIDYDSLIKPFLAPPAILFPIMWTIIYILMGISYGILKDNKLVNSSINLVYYLHLFVNALWSVFFFIFKWRLFSFIWIIFLIILVIIMIIKFYKENKLSGLIQLFYLLWILFASYLNLGFYLLNK